MLMVKAQSLDAKGTAEEEETESCCEGEAVLWDKRW